MKRTKQGILDLNHLKAPKNKKMPAIPAVVMACKTHAFVEIGDGFYSICMHSNMTIDYDGNVI